MINFAKEPVRAVPKPNHSKVEKPQKVQHNRNKPPRRDISNLSAKEDKRLKVRSNGVCEKCDSQRATDRAHIERRQKHTIRPVAEDFVHLCAGCHKWCDSGEQGRQWLIQFQQSLGEKEVG